MTLENFFDKQHLPELTNEYVCWLDMMGTRSLMERSTKSCTINICRLHCCLKRIYNQYQYDEIKLYPVMDGVFISSKAKDQLTTFLGEVFKSISNDFISEINQKKFLYQF